MGPEDGLSLGLPVGGGPVDTGGLGPILNPPIFSDHGKPESKVQSQQPEPICQVSKLLAHSREINKLCNHQYLQWNLDYLR